MGIGKLTWGSPRFETLVQNGDPANRLDVAILGDGYAEADMPLFYQDVDTIIGAFHDIEPMRTYIQHFNFHRVNIISQQSGVDDRWQVPPFKAKSALGAHFSFLSQRRLVGWDWRVWDVARRSGVPFDSLLVVVNTPRRGGATRFWLTVGYASRNSSDFPRIMIHESGHAIAKLMDEYTGELPDLPFLKGRSLPNFLPFANVSTSHRRPPWRLWIDPSTPTPTPLEDSTPADFVGAFEGAAYTNYGTYKPTRDCMMRRHSQPFCPVCQEQWIKRIYRKTAIADGRAPGHDVEVAVDADTRFAAQVIKPQHIKTQWRVRDQQGVWEVRQETADYAPVTLRFARPGRWTVECILEDHSPMLRKPAVIRRSQQKLRWIATVR